MAEFFKLPFEKQKGNVGEDAVRLYLEEILADQYSGMNRGGKNAARAREAVAGTAQRFAGDIKNARQNRAGIDNRNGPGQRFSVKNTIQRGWEDQLKNHRHSDTLVVQTNIDPFLKGSINDKPLAVPVSIITKAQSGKDLGHSISSRNIRRLQKGIEKAVFVVDDPSRNSIVYITNLKDHEGLITAAFLKDQEFDGDNVHKASSIHSRPDPVSMLESLGEDATVYVRKSELDKAPGSSMRIGTLKAQVKFIDDTIAEMKPKVKQNFFNSNQVKNEDNLNQTNDPDLRFSAAGEEDDGLDFGGELRRSYEEDTAEERDGEPVPYGEQKDETPPHPSPAATPSPQGEGLETGGADSSAAPQNDSGEDFEMLAREKKLALAEKLGIDGLKSRIETAESRLRMWKAMEKTGRRIQKNLTRFGKLFLQSTEKCFPKLRFSIHRSNGNLNDTSTFNFSFSTFNFFDMLKSPPWVIPGRAFCRYISVRTGSSAR